ncbi:MAG TPA: hypothetical protein VFB45_13615 [Pseudolabrys sp.]|nr:hypothetical protein [Pseudolabrys sp.]
MRTVSRQLGKSGFTPIALHNCGMICRDDAIAVITAAIGIFTLGPIAIFGAPRSCA